MSTQNETVISSIYNGLAEELGYDVAKRKLLEVVPKNLMEDASEFIANLESEKNRMQRDTIFNEKRAEVLSLMEDYRKEMQAVQKAMNQSLDAMNDEFIRLQKEVKKL